MRGRPMEVNNQKVPEAVVGDIGSRWRTGFVLG